MELWKSKKIWLLLFICCHVVVNTQFSFFIVYWLGHWCVTYYFSVYAHFYNDIFECNIVKHIKILIFFYPNYFLKIKCHECLFVNKNAR